jgi:TrmH family RNA methyltransferase
MSKFISSLQNPLIKKILSLRSRKDRDQSGLFLIEGMREYQLAKFAGIQIETLLTCPEIQKKALSSPLECSLNVFEKIALREGSDGIIAIGKQNKHPLSDLKIIQNGLYLVIESVEKPGNIGSILRSCDGAGVSAVIVCDPKTDLYNPNVVRSSLGTVFTVPVFLDSTSNVMKLLKKNNVQIVSTSPQASTNYTQVSYLTSTAIIMGSEQDGLTKSWLDHSDHLVKIPMLGKVDSLNVSTATTLMLYEVLRQRAL